MKNIPFWLLPLLAVVLLAHVATAVTTDTYPEETAPARRVRTSHTIESLYDNIQRDEDVVHSIQQSNLRERHSRLLYKFMESANDQVEFENDESILNDLVSTG